MTIRQKSAFRLETTWTPATAAESLAYSLTLTNLSAKPVEGFRLCVSGPARIDPQARRSRAGRWSSGCPTIPNSRRPTVSCSSRTASWTVTAHGLSYGLRHWTDGANTAYLAFADGTTAPVAVAPTRAVGDNATLKRGAEIYPVPDQAPVPVSIVPWPQQRRRLRPARRAAPGSISSPKAARPPRRGRELWRARRQPVSRRGHRAPGGRGRIPGLASRSARDSAAEAYAMPFRRPAPRFPAAPAPACSTG